MKEAKAGHITDEMKIVAEKEKVDSEFIRKGVARGRIVILKNILKKIQPLGIGEGLFIKINSNIGTSQKKMDIKEELEKARISIRYGADTLMDLSSGPKEQDIINVRKEILKEINIPLGTVPIYQSTIRSIEKRGGLVMMTEDDIFNVIEEQAKEGVDFFTIHAGVTLDIMKYIKKHPRYMGIVSRGGTIMGVWELKNETENPFYKNFDYLLELANNYDFGISLGDGLRPGCIFDSTDYPQIQELLTISKLVKLAREKNVQVIVEGPGHIPANQIEENIKIQKSVCDGAPFYVLGPLVTDIAPGYDHIVAAIGGTIAGMAGADYLCYVTPSEHLGLPTIEEVKEGIIASKIAAHTIDIVRRGDIAKKWDKQIDIARKNLDWNQQIQYSIDPEKARKIKERDGQIKKSEPCTMCGNLCAIKLLKDAIISDEKSDETII